MLHFVELLWRRITGYNLTWRCLPIPSDQEGFSWCYRSSNKQTPTHPAPNPHLLAYRRRRMEDAHTPQSPQHCPLCWHIWKVTTHMQKCCLLTSAKQSTQLRPPRLDLENLPPYVTGYWTFWPADLSMSGQATPAPPLVYRRTVYRDREEVDHLAAGVP